MGQSRLWRNEANRATFRAGSEQRALRSAQNLDTVEIEEGGKGIHGSEPDVPALDGRVIDVDAGRRGTRLRVDTPDADVRILVVVVGRRAVTVALKIDAR